MWLGAWPRLLLGCAVLVGGQLCGNSRIDQATEQCDNGGQRGCTANCLIDNLFYCYGVQSRCVLSYPFVSNTAATTAGGSGTLSIQSAATPTVGSITNAIVTESRNAFVSSANVQVNTVTPLGGTSFSASFVISFVSQNFGQIPTVTQQLRNFNLAPTIAGGLSSVGVTRIQFGNICGNGVVELGELCDTNGVLEDGCTQACVPSQDNVCTASVVTQPATGAPRMVCSRCGTRTIEFGEECDDGGFVNGDGCSSQCRVEVGFACFATSVCQSSLSVGVCGNTVIETGEACEGSAPLCIGCRTQNGAVCQNPFQSSQVCVAAAAGICGNGVLEGGEECDDRNSFSGDGCSNLCKVETGFLCNKFRSVCAAVVGATCGNRVIEGGEQCDDGNLINADGCNSLCQIEAGFVCSGVVLSVCVRSAAICGDGIVQNGEPCDDGNIIPGDGCSSICTIESGFTCSIPAGTVRSVCTRTTACGNGIIEFGETCDDGNFVNGDGCNTACQVETGFICATVGTRSICSINQCGNGIHEAGEECDDGSTGVADGCSDQCRVNPGYTCFDVNQRSVCSLCGDGRITGNEACDDGNSVGGDGCSAACQLEIVFFCLIGPPTQCFRGCGNGLVANGEQCDDGNNIGGDGCSAFCLVESGYICDPRCRLIGAPVAGTVLAAAPSGSDSPWWAYLLGFGIPALLLLLCLLFYFLCRRKPKPMIPPPAVQKAPLYIHPPPIGPPTVIVDPTLAAGTVTQI